MLKKSNGASYIQSVSLTVAQMISIEMYEQFYVALVLLYRQRIIPGYIPCEIFQDRWQSG